MKDNMLGIDMGHNQLKMVVMKDGRITQFIEQDMPENLMKDGRIVSVDTMASLIKDLMKENGISVNKAAISLSDEVIYVRDIILPVMSEEQLLYNLPYEFRDYITEELNNYYYDYAMIQSNLQENGTNKMRLLAVCVSKAIVEEIRTICKKAGLQLVKLAPAISGYQALLRKNPVTSSKQCAILDLGQQSLRFYIFNKSHYETMRILENGISKVIDCISDQMHVDRHVAHTYLYNNYDNCHNNPEVLEIFERIAIELKRAINFYQFSNPENSLTDIYLSGGGSNITPLRELFEKELGLQIHNISDLIGQKDINSAAIAVGITLDNE